MVAADVAAAVDHFLRQQKVIVGSESPGAWAAGHSANERVIYLPLEVAGELTGAKLMVVGFPDAQSLKFRLAILFPGNVCRLDFTDETHTNSYSTMADAVPWIVQGPHYHSWAINRRFCRGGNLPARLHNAANFETSGRSFDAILRWFCADNGITGLPPNHGIKLPSRERLL